jgi:hypothetical protein
MLMRIIDEDKKKRKMNAEYFNPETENEIKEIYRQVQSRKEEQKKLGFETSIEFSIYNLLQEDNDDKEKSIKITKQLNEKLFPETQIVEWYNKAGIKRKMEESIYDILDSHNISEDKIKELSEKILRIYNKDNV